MAIVQGTEEGDILFSVEDGDILQGLGGNDLFFDPPEVRWSVQEGGLGDDTFHIDNARDEAVELAGEGHDRVRLYYLESYTLPDHIEDLILFDGEEGEEGGDPPTPGAKNGTGNSLDNYIGGNNENNVLLGLGGNDFINAGWGLDYVDGGAGNDSIDGGWSTPTLPGGESQVIGGAGADSFMVRGAANYIVEDFEVARDRISAHWGHTTYLRIDQIGNDAFVVYGEADTPQGIVPNGLLLKNVDASELTETNFEFVQEGNKDANQLFGGEHNDELSGLANNDTLAGRAGEDALRGGTGEDSLRGGDGSDLLRAGAGEDRLLGGSGQDTVSGGQDSDELIGSAGGDTFIFAGGFGTDTIADFRDDVDTIQLRAESLGVTSRADALSNSTVVDGNTVFTFRTGDVLVVENVADKSLLSNDIEIV